MRSLGWIIALLLACSRPAADPPSSGRLAAEPPSSDRLAAAHPAVGAGAFHRMHDRREPVIAGAPALALAVTVDGAAASWNQDAFDKVARYTRGSDGEARDVWSLRELTHTLVGPTARVTSVTGEDGTRAIDRAAWDDATHTPLLHTTRRGTLKFRWADAAGTWGESEVKDVTRLEIAR